MNRGKSGQQSSRKGSQKASAGMITRSKSAMAATAEDQADEADDDPLTDATVVPASVSSRTDQRTEITPDAIIRRPALQRTPPTATDSITTFDASSPRPVPGGYPESSPAYRTAGESFVEQPGNYSVVHDSMNDMKAMLKEVLSHEMEGMKSMISGLRADVEATRADVEATRADVEALQETRSTRSSASESRFPVELHQPQRFLPVIPTGTNAWAPPALPSQDARNLQRNLANYPTLDHPSHHPSHPTLTRGRFLGPIADDHRRSDRIEQAQTRDQEGYTYPPTEWTAGPSRIHEPTANDYQRPDRDDQNRSRYQPAYQTSYQRAPERTQYHSQETHSGLKDNYDSSQPPRRSREDFEIDRTPRLKASEIGYWDPEGKATKNDEFRPERMEVTLFVDRLRDLADTYGSKQVLINMKAAMVHCHDWIGGLSKMDKQRLTTLDGYIELLLRDFSKDEAVMRRQAQAFSHRDAHSTRSYWNGKVNRLRSGGYEDENLIYYEVWSTLPYSWKGTIATKGSLEYLREQIHQKEAAWGWPTKDTPATNEYSNSRKSALKDETPASDRIGPKTSKSAARTIPNCRICLDLGKKDEKHWHRDCPNKEAMRARVNRMVANLEQGDECELASSPHDGDDLEQISDSNSDEPCVETISRVYSDQIINAVLQNEYRPTTHRKPQIFEAKFFSATGLGTGNVFKLHGPSHVYIRSSEESEDLRVCVDSGCGPVIGNRTFVLKLFPNAKILLRQDWADLRVKGGFGNQQYEVLAEFVVVSLFLVTTKGNLLKINCEIHLTDSGVDSGILLGVAALRSNGIVCDFNKEVMTAPAQDGTMISVPLYFSERRRPINQTLHATEAILIPGGSQGLVKVNLQGLPDRDFNFQGTEWFDPKKGIYAKAAHGVIGVIDEISCRVTIANFGDAPVMIQPDDIVGTITDLSADATFLEADISKKGQGLKAQRVGRSLSSFSKDFHPSSYEFDDDIGISFEDIYYVNNAEDPHPVMQMDHVIKDRWNFAATLSDSQRAEAKSLLESINIWNGIGCLNTGDLLRMPLKPECIGTRSIQNSYPMSEPKRMEYNKLETELESQGVIEDSEVTDFCSPAMIVTQKGKPRLVIDFRKINEMSLKDVYPLPRQADVFPKLQGARYISCFDMKKSFYQFPLHPDDRNKTTFKTRHGGAKRLTRSLMGYINSPAHCQRIMDRIIKQYKWIYVVVYMDDIIVYSATWTEHMEHIKWVLQQISDVGLTLDPAKAYVGFDSIEILGHLVNRFGLAMQSSKVEAMIKLPDPTTIREVMQVANFFGYYRNFIRGFAMIMHPITSLLTGGKKGESSRARLQKRIVWGPEQIKAYRMLKEKLKEATYLSHALEGDDIKFRLYVDACKIGMGAALHIVVPQTTGEGDTPNSPETERPVVFLSRSLKTSERNFWPTELEMAGLVWSLKQLEETIEGRSLEIFTDHSALQWLFNATNCKTRHNQRLFLWAMELEKYKKHATVQHRPGRAHINADVLSRYPVDIDTPSTEKRSLSTSDAPPMREDFEIDAISSCALMSDAYREALQQGYLTDRHWKTLYQKLIHDVDQTGSDVIYHSYKLDKASRLLYYVDPKDKGMKICIPRTCIEAVLRLNHDELGHPGFKRTFDRIYPNYQFDQMSKLIKSYVSGCPKCQTNKNKDHRAGLLHPLEIPLKPCDDIAMDFVNGLPPDRSGKFDAILTITDKFSKVVTLIPCRTDDTAEHTADRFFKNYYSRYGLPQRIVSDRDVRFVSKFWKELFKRLKVPLLMSTAHAPQTDGASERTNQTMEVMLRSLIGYKTEGDWVQHLPTIEFCINTQTSSTGLSPYLVLYGFRPSSVGDQLRKTSPFEAPEITYIGDRLEQLRKDVHDKLQWSNAMMALHYDKSRHVVPLKPGDTVFIENRDGLKIPGLEKGKTAPRRFGPFEILKLVGKGACKVKLPHNYKMHDVISMRHLTKANEDPFNRFPERPPGLIDESMMEVELEVESVIDKRKNRKHYEYLVKWKGYPVWESTWVHENQKHTFLEAIQDFETRDRKDS